MTNTLKAIVLASMAAISLNCDCSCREIHKAIDNISNPKTSFNYVKEENPARTAYLGKSIPYFPK